MSPTSNDAGQPAKLPDSPSVEELQAFFSQDRFAAEMAGCRVVEGRQGHAVCEMPLMPTHHNAMGNVMGGAIFTLADFALAVACNVGEEPTVSVDSTISFFKPTRGTKLIATAEVERSGRHLGFYTVSIADDEGADIARMTATCYR